MTEQKFENLIADLKAGIRNTTNYINSTPKAVDEIKEAMEQNIQDRLKESKRAESIRAEYYEALKLLGVEDYDPANDEENKKEEHAHQH